MSIAKMNDWLNVAANAGIIVGLVFVGMEYRNNSALVQIEAGSTINSQFNDIIDVTISDQSLIEIMGKPAADLTQAESDRLRLLGIRMFLALDANFRDAVARGTDGLARAASINPSIYHRPRLNHGLPHAWETYKARTGASPFVQWFEATVVNAPTQS